MMTRTTIFIIVFGMLILATACVQQDINTLAKSVNTPTAEQRGDEKQLQQEGIGPLEITPDPAGGERASASSNDQVSGNISSSGQRTAGRTISGESGQVESVAPSGFAGKQEAPQPASWLTYQDQAFLFSIDYPDTYSILPETAQLSDTDPAIIHRVRFLDLQLAAGETADFEIPNFAIEIYELGDQTLEAFLDSNFGSGVREEYTLGDQTGYRVHFIQLIAPNEFYYFSEHGYVYKLTPLGLYGEEMLHSFEIE